jgi:parallel beta-helix repeat protein
MKTIKLSLIIVVLVCASALPSTNSAIEHASFKIDSDADFTALGFRGSGVKTDPYIIESLTINSIGSMSNGIEVSNTHAYFVIRDCLIHAEYIAINIHDVAAGTATIQGNILVGTKGDGGGVVLGADGVRVIGNTCTNFAEGIHTNYTDDSLIADNNLSNNTYHGVSLRYSSRNIVTNNTVMRNGAHGIFLIRNSQGNSIYNNTISGNSEMKSYDWDTDYHFIVNSQAADEGGGNTWYSAKLRLGNHWSDYGGLGVYKIDGSANAADSYPSKIGEAPSGKPQTYEPTNTSSQSWIPSFPYEAIVLGVALSMIYRLKRARALLSYIE